MTAEGDQSKLACPIEPVNGTEPNISTVPILNTSRSYSSICSSPEPENSTVFPILDISRSNSTPSCSSSTSPDPKISPAGSLSTSSSSLSIPKKLRKPVGYLKGYIFS